LGYPLPRVGFFFDIRFIASMAGGIIVALIGYWRILRGDWLERALWILLYSSIIHTLFLLPDARYEYMFGIPSSLLIARYLLMLWERTKSYALKIAAISVLALMYIVPQVINAQAMAAESLELANYSHETQKWAFDAMQARIRYPFERGLLTKKEFIPSDHFLSKLYLYTPYREEVERYYSVKLPKPEELGLPVFQPEFPMNEPTDWMKTKKKQ
jgi:hypothetical protein